MDHKTRRVIDAHSAESRRVTELLWDANAERDAARARVEQLAADHKRTAKDLEAAKELIREAYALVAQLERLLRAALDENPSWYSEATKEAEALLSGEPANE